MEDTRELIKKTFEELLAVLDGDLVYDLVNQVTAIENNEDNYYTEPDPGGGPPYGPVYPQRPSRVMSDGPSEEVDLLNDCLSDLKKIYEEVERRYKEYSLD